MQNIKIVRPTHAMTLPLLDRAIDVILVVAGDNKASIGHELFKVHKRRFKYPVELVQPKSRIGHRYRDDLAEDYHPPKLFREIQRCWKRASFSDSSKLIG